MQVLLFDMYATGHHLEYANGLATALATQDPTLEVDFLTVAPDDRERVSHGPDATDYLYEESPFPDSPELVPSRLTDIYEYVATEISNPRWDVVRDLVEYVQRNDYDLIHFLEIDKLHAHLSVQLREADLPPVVGTINGVFFKPVNAILPVESVGRVLDRTGMTAFVKHVPPALYKGVDWNRWFLRRCLAAGVIDHLFVHSETAREELATDWNRDTVETMTVVPDPLKRWDGSESARRAARRELDLPTDEVILLFFGQMRTEKGIGTLLEALAEYDGPSFTMVLAGPPSAVTEEDIAEVAAHSRVDIVPRLEFVPQAEVRTYFQAADGVVLPYHRSFGSARTSGVFQKACATGRPVIASDFGVLGRRVREWDLGLCCRPADAHSLRDALTEFVIGDGPVYDSDSISAYARTQTYDRLAVETDRVYRRVVDDKASMQ